MYLHNTKFVALSPNSKPENPKLMNAKQWKSSTGHFSTHKSYIVKFEISGTHDPKTQIKSLSVEKLLRHSIFLMILVRCSLALLLAVNWKLPETKYKGSICKTSWKEWVVINHTASRNERKIFLFYI